MIGGVFDGTNLTAYADGVAGSVQTGLPANADLVLQTKLRGRWGVESTVPFLGSGSQNSKWTDAGGYLYSNAEALFSAADLIVFDKALTSTQMAQLTTLLQTHAFNGLSRISFGVLAH